MTEGVYYLKIQLQKASGSRYYFIYLINILIKKKVLRINLKKKIVTCVVTVLQ